MWIKNTNGKSDAMLTFAAVSFAVVTLNIFLSSFDSVSFSNFNITFKALDSSIMAIYLGSTFTAYVSRRWTDKKYHKEESSSMLSEVVSSVSEAVASEQGDVALSQIEMQEPPTTEVEPGSKRRRSKKETV
jgi:hypothetical protein